MLVAELAFGFDKDIRSLLVNDRVMREGSAHESIACSNGADDTGASAISDDDDEDEAEDEQDGSRAYCL